MVYFGVVANNLTARLTFKHKSGGKVGCPDAGMVINPVINTAIRLSGGSAQ